MNKITTESYILPVLFEVQLCVTVCLSFFFQQRCRLSVIHVDVIYGIS